MKFPFKGEPVSYSDYFKLGTLNNHIIGVAGGVIWCLGMSFNFIASSEAGFAISYGLGQGATLVAACWGVFVWKEFKGADLKIQTLLFAMFIFFVSGLTSLVLTKL